jgi:hypothetical protein
MLREIKTKEKEVRRPNMKLGGGEKTSTKMEKRMDRNEKE